MKKFIPLLFIIAILATGCSQNLNGQGITNKEFELAGEKVIVGNTLLGAGEDKFKPEVKLQKWGDETSIRVWTDDEVEDKAKEENGKVKVKSKDKKKEYNFYPTTYTNSEGQDIEAFEYEVILLEKPDTNIVSLNMDLTGLECYYQPELTQKEIDEGTFRPEDVIGSYACYHESKSGDYTALGGKNYMAGKAFHIYRPKMCDSAGNCIWGEFNTDMNETGILTNTIPQEFLDNAVYPIKHAIGDTFGYEDYTESQRFNWGDDIFASVYTALSGGNVSKLTIYSKSETNSGGKGLIINSGDLTILDNGITNIVIPGISIGWDDFEFSVEPTIIASNYYLGWITDSQSRISYDTVTNIGLTDSSNSYSSPTDPTDGSTDNYKYSIYATYTPSGGGEPYYGHTGGDWYINTELWIDTSTTTPGDIYIGEGGSLNCTQDGVTITAKSRTIGNGGSFSGCNWSLWNPS